MKYPFYPGLLMTFVLALRIAHAGTDEITSFPNPEGYYPHPAFHTSTEIRTEEGIGFHVGAYGGVTAFQNGTLKITSPSVPGAELDGHTESRPGGVAGLKFGMTWPNFSSLVNQPEGEPGLVMPALEANVFWTGFNYKATDASFGSGGSLTADVNTITFSLNPELKFRLGSFHPYFGFGLGGTYIDAGNAQVTVPGIGTGKLTGSSNDLDFSVQGVAGAELFFDQHWALNLEYRYLYIVDPTFHGNIGGADVNYHLDGFGTHLFTAGIGYYF